MKNRNFQLFAIMIFVVIVLFFVLGIMNIGNVLSLVHGDGVKKLRSWEYSEIVQAC